MMNIDISVPFPLAYLDWCKEKGIKTLKDTENNALVMEFGKLYTQKGGKIEIYEILIARGDKINDFCIYKSQHRRPNSKESKRYD